MNQQKTNIDILAYLRGVDLTNYKKCKSQVSEECLDIAEKINFKGKTCKFCYNYERLIYIRNKRDKIKMEKLISDINSSKNTRPKIILQPN